MLHRITVTPVQRHISAAHGANLLDVLRRAGLSVHAPCGGAGQCGKCKVLLDGQEVLACQTVIDRDMTVALPSGRNRNPWGDRPCQGWLSSGL